MAAAHFPDAPSDGTVDLSLVCSTIGRTDDLARMIKSLPAAARSATLQLIVVDQSPDQAAKRVLTELASGFRWDYLTSPRGLSVGRNVGLAAAQGSIIAFPDDDCTYPPGVLSKVVSYLDARADVDGVLLRAVADPTGEDLLRYPSSGRLVSRRNVFRTGISIGTFLRSRTTTEIGLFDESLGVGAGTVWASGEEADYLLRALRLGTRLRYLPDLTVLHPPLTGQIGRSARQQAFSNGRGVGRVLRKHHYLLPYPSYLALRRAARVMGLTARNRRGEAAVAGAWAMGLVTGYLDDTQGLTSS